jgi:hypothetical protein
VTPEAKPPVLTIKYSVEFEMEYDPFKGKTPDELAVSMEDDLHGALFDLRPGVQGLFTRIESIEEFN